MPEITEEEKALRLALARFTLLFALTDEALHHLFYHLTGMKIRIARLLFGETEAMRIKQLLLKILPHANIAPVLREPIEKAMARLAEINIMRKHLIHRVNFFVPKEGNKFLSVDLIREGPGRSRIDAPRYGIEDIEIGIRDLDVIQRELKLLAIAAPNDGLLTFHVNYRPQHDAFLAHAKSWPRIHSEPARK